MEWLFDRHIAAKVLNYKWDRADKPAIEAMPQLFYPTRPRTSNACQRKKYRLPVHSLLSDSPYQSLFSTSYRIIMLFGQSSYSESMSDNLARASSAREYQIELQQVGINTATSPMLNEIAFIFQSFWAKKFERGSLPCHSEGRSR